MGILVGMLGPLWGEVVLGGDGCWPIMLLTGTFHRSLDEKHRFAIPKRLRDSLGHPRVSTLFLAPGTDGSLALYTEQAFSQLAERLGGSSPTGPDVRAFGRLFYAHAQSVDVDRQGRVRIPPELAALAGLRKDVVLVGVGGHMEIWDRNHWQQYLAAKQPHYDQIAEKAFNYPAAGSNVAAPSAAPQAERPAQPR